MLGVTVSPDDFWEEETVVVHPLEDLHEIGIEPERVIDRVRERERAIHARRSVPHTLEAEPPTLARATHAGARHRAPGGLLARDSVISKPEHPHQARESDSNTSRRCGRASRPRPVSRSGHVSPIALARSERVRRAWIGGIGYVVSSTTRTSGRHGGNDQLGKRTSSSPARSASAALQNARQKLR